MKLNKILLIAIIVTSASAHAGDGLFDALNSCPTYRNCPIPRPARLIIACTTVIVPTAIGGALGGTLFKSTFPAMWDGVLIGSTIGLMSGTWLLLCLSFGKAAYEAKLCC
jgi:hypothetical protein